MSRYLAFVLLALSASSTLAAPAELPAMPAVPDLTGITGPTLGSRSNAPYKRDWQYPTSTEDCRLSEVPDKSTTPSYTHDGKEYSEECLTRLALSVPFEDRKSCRTTGANARGYDEECLFKKAFDEDWKFDLEKAKEDELAWREANPSYSSSDAWRTHYPSAVSHCFIDIELDLDLELNLVGDGKKEEGGKKKGTKTSDGMDGWTPYSTLPSGQTVDNDCILRLVLSAKIDIDLGTCSVKETPKKETLKGRAAVPLIKRSTELVAPRDVVDDVVAVVVKILTALQTGCLIEIIVTIITKLGAEVELLVGPLEAVVGLVVGLLDLLEDL